MKSHGIPAAHQVKAVLKPADIPPVDSPIKKYRMEHRAPKHRPNIPDKIAHRMEEVFFLNSQAIRTSRGQAYRYIIHQRWTPYRAPSIRINTGTTAATFHPKNKVNIMSQKLVSSIFGILLRINLDTSITATMSPIWVISDMGNLLLRFFISPGISGTTFYRL